MAREMILVPKLKYEHLLHKLDHTKDQSTQAVLETTKSSEKTSEDPGPNITDQLDDTNKLVMSVRKRSEDLLKSLMFGERKNILHGLPIDNVITMNKSVMFIIYL